MVAMLGGCGDDMTVSPDASVEVGPPIGVGLNAPIGATCDVSLSYWCAQYAGVCAHAVCRAQCRGVELPRCPLGQREVHEDLGAGMQCYCAPD